MKELEILQSPKNPIIHGDMATGKTKNVIFPIIKKIITNNDTLIILDPKCEYYNEFNGSLSDQGYHIIQFDLIAGNTPLWNPFSNAYHYYQKNCIDKTIDALELIGDYLFGNDTDFWSKAMKEYFIGLALYSFTKDKNATIKSIYSLLDKEEKLKEYFINKRSQIAYRYLEPTLSRDKDTKDSIIHSLQNALLPYITRENLSLIISESSFNTSAILKEPTAIFINYKVGNSIHSSFVSLFIEQLYNYISDNKSFSKTYFILDNFDTLNELYNLKNMLSMTNTYNIALIVATRSLDNIITKYTPYINSLCNIISSHEETEETSADDDLEKTTEVHIFEYKHVANDEIESELVQFKI